MRSCCVHAFRSGQFPIASVMTVVLLVAFAATGASAASPERDAPSHPTWRPPTQFTLARAVPPGACLYVHWVQGPGQETTRPHWVRFWRNVWAANVHEDVKRFLLPAISGERRGRFEKGWPLGVQRFGALDWDRLTRQEVVVLARMKGLHPEIAMLFRDLPDKAETDAKAIETLFDALAGLDEDLQVIPLDLYGAQTRILASARSQTCLQMARRNDVIALCFGQRPPELMDDVLALLEGKSRREPLPASPRFQAAMALLPKPQDRMSYVNVALAVEQILKARPASGGESSATLRSVGIGPAARQLLQTLPIFDHVASVGWTEGRRHCSECVTALAGDAEKKALYPAMAKQRPLERIDRYVPADARALRIAAGINPAAAYDAVVDALRNAAIDPEAFAAEWQRIQEQFGLSIRSDLLEWLSGRNLIILLPCAVGSPEGSDLVLMLELSNAPDAAVKARGLSDQLAKITAEWEQPLTATPLTLKGVEFRRLAPQQSSGDSGAVLGVVEGWLMVSTDAEAAARCLATAQGEAPSIATNPRYRAQALAATGPVDAASFADLTHFGRDMSRLLSLIGLVEQFMPATPETEGAKGLLSFLHRLSRPMRALDFLSSTSSQTTFDGRIWRTRRTLVYKPPAPTSR
jgi:hypothetical protein